MANFNNYDAFSPYKPSVRSPFSTFGAMAANMAAEDRAAQNINQYHRDLLDYETADQNRNVQDVGYPYRLREADYKGSASVANAQADNSKAIMRLPLYGVAHEKIDPLVNQSGLMTDEKGNKYVAGVRMAGTEGYTTDTGEKVAPGGMPAGALADLTTRTGEFNYTLPPKPLEDPYGLDSSGDVVNTGDPYIPGTVSDSALTPVGEQVTTPPAPAAPANKGGWTVRPINGNPEALRRYNERGGEIRALDSRIREKAAVIERMKSRMELDQLETGGKNKVVYEGTIRGAQLQIDADLKRRREIDAERQKYIEPGSRQWTGPGEAPQLFDPYKIATPPKQAQTATPAVPRSDLPKMSFNQLPGKTPMQKVSYLYQREGYGVGHPMTGPLIVALESSNGKFLDNPRSTASGPAQFTDSTFLGVAKKWPITKGMSDGQILALRSLPYYSTRAEMDYRKQNQAVLQQKMEAKGFRVDDSHPLVLYAMHHFGPGNGPTIMEALAKYPDRPLANVLGSKYADVKAANPYLWNKEQGRSLTTRELMNVWANRARQFGYVVDRGARA
jgi:hypothetical protein